MVGILDLQIDQIGVEWPLAVDELQVEDVRLGRAKNLRHMLRFGEVFEAEEIVYALSRQLS